MTIIDDIKGSFAAQLHRRTPRKWRLFGEMRQELSRRQYFSSSAVAFAVFLLVWSLLTYRIFPAFDRASSHWQFTTLIDRFYLRSPTEVLAGLFHMLIYENFLSDIKASIFRVCGGFAAACLLAIPLGVLAGSYRRIDALVSPFAAFIRYMPAMAFIPLIIVCVGIGDNAKMFLIFLGTFWYVLILITDATAAVQLSYLEAAYTLGASQWQTLTRVVLPAVAPEILNCVKAMIGAAWTYVVVAEMICMTNGMGLLIYKTEDQNRIDKMLAGIVAVGIIGIITNVLFEFINLLAFPWRRSHKAAEGS